MKSVYAFLWTGKNMVALGMELFMHGLLPRMIGLAEAGDVPWMRQRAFAASF